MNEEIKDLKEMITMVDETMTPLSDYKEILHTAQIQYERINNDIKEFVRNFTLEAAESPEMDKPVDPRTGRTNQDWTNLLMEAKLAENESYIELRAKLYEAQEVLFDAQYHIEQIVDMRNAIKIKAQLLDILVRAEEWMKN